MMQVTTGETGGNPVVWGADSRHLFHASATPRPSDGDPLRDGMAVIELVTEPGLAVIRRRTMRGLPPNERYDLSPGWQDVRGRIATPRQERHRRGRQLG